MRKSSQIAGSSRVGPSPEYVRLIKGQLSSKDYVDKLKRDAGVSKHVVSPRRP
jgi:hypothetical protein